MASGLTSSIPANLVPHIGDYRRDPVAKIMMPKHLPRYLGAQERAASESEGVPQYSCPRGQFGGKALRATLVIAPTVDPGFPSTYTRSGLLVSFRPHAKKFKLNPKAKKPPAHPTTLAFFSSKNMYSAAEYEMRDDGCKWEPCFHGEKKFKHDALHKPTFDIQYQHREMGAKATSPQPIPYALVVSVRAPSVRDLYNQVVRQYRVLTPLRSAIRIPIKGTP